MTLWVGAAVVVAAVALGGGREEPRPLSGDPLKTTNGLRLVVADDPPFVLDVDSGKSTRVPGLRKVGNVSVMPVAGRAGVVVAGSGVYAVQGSAPKVTRLGAARAVVPAAGGGAVWLKVSAGTSCALREVRLSGRATGARSRTPCGWFVQPGGSTGVVVRRTTLIDPATGRVLYRAPFGILAAVGQKVVLDGPGKAFTLVDVMTGAERQLPWPSVLGFQDRPAADPGGRFVVLAFANPAYSDADGNTVGQVMDAWLLDTHTAELTQVPGMPAFVGLKSTHMEWTSDGRLVILGDDGQRDFVVVWRPGQDRLAVKTVKLQERSGYSDSFAPLR